LIKCCIFILFPKIQIKSYYLIQTPFVKIKSKKRLKLFTPVGAVGKANVQKNSAFCDRTLLRLSLIKACTTHIAIKQTDRIVRIIRQSAVGFLLVLGYGILPSG
jgi:hypothetical protein